jgi:hypothetical protein
MALERVWRRVWFADELLECSDCGEGVCPSCKQHFADCPCPGPTQEDLYQYKEMCGGLYARRL